MNDDSLFHDLWNYAFLSEKYFHDSRPHVLHLYFHFIVGFSKNSKAIKNHGTAALDKVFYEVPVLN